MTIRMSLESIKAELRQRIRRIWGKTKIDKIIAYRVTAFPVVLFCKSLHYCEKKGANRQVHWVQWLIQWLFVPLASLSKKKKARLFSKTLESWEYIRILKISKTKAQSNNHNTAEWRGIDSGLPKTANII